MKIRPFRESDYDDVFRLYREQSAALSFHHNVRRDQFKKDLFTTRFIRNPADHHMKARVAFVALKKNRICAFASGGLVIKGDEVVEAGTGYIQAIIAEPSSAAAVKEVLPRVIAHIRGYEPKKIVAQDACMCPVFFADSAGSLPSRWAWIGQCLLDVGFEVSSRSLRLVARFDGPLRKVVAPRGLKFFRLTHEMHSFDPRYDFGCVLLKPPYQYGDGVVWCGNFYSGVFVKGTAYRSLYMNYFTIMDEAYRGKGLGRLVLQYCLYEAQQRGAHHASLLTDIDNLVAQNLYQSEGFEVVDAMHSFELNVKQKV